MWFFLDLLYLSMGLLAIPYFLYGAIFQGKYRSGWGTKLLGAVAPRHNPASPCIWFHAASLGEVNLLVPLVNRWRQEHPETEIVITATTDTGIEQAKAKFPDCIIEYAPMDFSWSVARVLDTWKPQALVLAELELWPNLIAAAKSRGLIVAVVNARMSDRSYSNYRLAKWLLGPTFASLDLVAAQTGEYATRFQELGVPPGKVHVTGSIKFDGAPSDRSAPNVRRLAELAGISRTDMVFLAGSTQPEEDLVALDAFESLRGKHPNLRLILVPRHPHRFDDVARAIAARGLTFQRRTELENSEPHPAARVLLVDTVGELSAWWGTAQLAYVGGSMGDRGGQNMIEPAAYGAAVSFGPRTENFREVVSLMLAEDAATVVADGAALQQFLAKCLETPAFAAESGDRAKRLVARHKGATSRTVRALEQELGSAALKLGLARDAARRNGDDRKAA